MFIILRFFYEKVWKQIIFPTDIWVVPKKRKNMLLLVINGDASIMLPIAALSCGCTGVYFPFLGWIDIPYFERLFVCAALKMQFHLKPRKHNQKWGIYPAFECIYSKNWTSACYWREIATAWHKLQIIFGFLLNSSVSMPPVTVQFEVVWSFRISSQFEWLRK